MLIRKEYLAGFLFLFNSVLSSAGICPLTTPAFDSLYVQDIQITGNNRTRATIILRELEFDNHSWIHKGELPKLFTESRENLINSSLFNYVELDTLHASEDKNIIIQIVLKERWYTWPFPVIESRERNLNSWWEKKELDKLTYGLYLRQENVRGRMEVFEVKISRGFDEELVVGYLIPYINRQQTLGLGLYSGWVKNHAVKVATINNKEVFLKHDNDYLNEENFFATLLTYRRNIHTTHSLELRYDNFYFHDSISFVNSRYVAKGINDPDFFSFIYTLKIDHRDYKHYPLKGVYADFMVVKYGLGITAKKGIDMLYTQYNLRKYWQINGLAFFASGISAKVSFDRFQPYFKQQGLGYNRDFVRGFEYYVIDGQHYALFKNNLKFRLLPTIHKRLTIIPIEKFRSFRLTPFLNLFCDAAWVEDEIHDMQNSLSNRFLLGYGVGLDVLSYYDAVMRVEYALNNLQERGIFIHFMAPI